MIAIAAGEDKIGAGLSQCARKILAESAAGSSNNCHSATEIKEFVHEIGPGESTTFIRLGSRACSRSNHCGPSSSGAIALMSGFTRIAPLLKSSMARGYSPADAHDP